MNPRLNELLERMRRLEDDIEREFAQQRTAMHADLDQTGAWLREELLAQQRRFRMGVLHYLGTASLRNVISAPFIYAMLVPLLLLDLCVTLYQWVCFPLYGIAHVRRRDYLVLDRSQLAYLNIIEKFNCAYCAYATGLVAYLGEVIGRTEQYWCPIKHAQRMLHEHPYYDRFAQYGDGERYRHGLQALRAELAGSHAGTAAPAEPPRDGTP